MEGGNTTSGTNFIEITSQVEIKDEILEQKIEINQKLTDLNSTEQNPIVPNPTESTPTESTLTESTPTEPCLTEPKLESNQEFNLQLKPNLNSLFHGNSKSFLVKTPLVAIFVFYLLITIGIMCDQSGYYRYDFRPIVTNCNSILVIVLFWSMVESTVKKYPLVICFIINALLVHCDFYVLCKLNVNCVGFYLILVTLVSRPLVCFIFYGKFLNRLNGENIRVNEDLSKSEHQTDKTEPNFGKLELNQKCEQTAKIESKQPLQCDSDKQKNSLLTKIPIVAIFGLNCFILSLLIGIDHPWTIKDSKVLVILCNIFLLISFGLLLIEQIKSQSLMLMLIGFNLLAAWADFNLAYYLYLECWNVYIFASFWLLIFSFITRPITTVILHHHLTTFRKLDIKSPISKLFDDLKVHSKFKSQRDIEANEKTTEQCQAKPWDQFRKEIEDEDASATTKAKCFKCSFSIEF